MSCDDCEKAIENGTFYYYRLENANIAISACQKHFIMLRDKLREKL